MFANKSLRSDHTIAFLAARASAQNLGRSAVLGALLIIRIYIVGTYIGTYVRAYVHTYARTYVYT